MNIYTTVLYCILGSLIGHPAMAAFDDGSGGKLETLDSRFDDYAYWSWRNWDGSPSRLDEWETECTGPRAFEP